MPLPELGPSRTFPDGYRRESVPRRFRPDEVLQLRVPRRHSPHAIAVSPRLAEAPRLSRPPVLASPHASQRHRSSLSAEPVYLKSEREPALLVVLHWPSGEQT